MAKPSNMPPPQPIVPKNAEKKIRANAAPKAIMVVIIDADGGGAWAARLDMPGYIRSTQAGGGLRADATCAESVACLTCCQVPAGTMAAPNPAKRSNRIPAEQLAAIQRPPAESTRPRRRHTWPEIAMTAGASSTAPIENTPPTMRTHSAATKATMRAITPALGSAEIGIG